jgi:septal ring factor EnvC (AmiA/AmiB activator)
LSQIDQQILDQQKLVDEKKSERQSIERDVAILEAEIKKSQLAIQARAISIKNLGAQIGEKEEVVTVLDSRLEKQRQSVASLLRKTQEIDNNSLVELMLTNQNFSEFFADFEDYRTIGNSLRQSLQVLGDIKVDTLEQKRSLEDKQSEEARHKKLQEEEKSTIEAKEAEKSEILQVTKGQEAVYQAHLAETQRTASQLRAALFELAGGSGKIPFPQAVQLAKVASERTGVPAALILAILEQESSFGSNIGQCTYNQEVQGKPTMGPGLSLPSWLTYLVLI